MKISSQIFLAGAVIVFLAFFSSSLAPLSIFFWGTPYFRSVSIDAETGVHAAGDMIAVQVDVESSYSGSEDMKSKGYLWTLVDEKLVKVQLIDIGKRGHHTFDWQVPTSGLAEGWHTLAVHVTIPRMSSGWASNEPVSFCDNTKAIMDLPAYELHIYRSFTCNFASANKLDVNVGGKIVLQAQRITADAKLPVQADLEKALASRDGDWIVQDKTMAFCIGTCEPKTITEIQKEIVVERDTMIREVLGGESGMWQEFITFIKSLFGK